MTDEAAAGSCLSLAETYEALAAGERIVTRETMFSSYQYPDFQ